MASTVTRSQSNRASMACGGTGDSHHGWAADMLSCQYGPKSLRNVSNTLLNLCHKELRQFWRKNGVQPGTSKVHLITWPVSVYLYSISQKAWHPLPLLHNDITELLDVRHMVLLHLPLEDAPHVLNRVQVWRHTWPLPHLHLHQQGSCHLGSVFRVVAMLENSFWREGIIFCFRMSPYMLESMFPSMNHSYPVPAGRCHTCSTPSESNKFTLDLSDHSTWFQ